MTDSLDPRNAPDGSSDTTADSEASPTDPDALTFDTNLNVPGLDPADNTHAAAMRGAVAGGALGGNVGYTGGLATGNQGAAGMRQIVTDEAAEAADEGADDETPANLAQGDQ